MLIFSVYQLLIHFPSHCLSYPTFSYHFINLGAFATEIDKGKVGEVGPMLDRLFLDLQQVDLSDIEKIKKIVLPNSHFPAEAYQPNRQLNTLLVREAEKDIWQIVQQYMFDENYPNFIPGLLVLGSAGVGKVCLALTLKFKLCQFICFCLDLGCYACPHWTYSRKEDRHLSQP